MKYIYVKAGGSFITVKSKPIKINYEALESLRRIISESKDGEIGLILGNGGGSFAHYTVSKYINTGDETLLVKCHEATRILNRIIVDYLVESNIYATSVQTSAIIQYDHKTGEFAVFYKPVEVLLSKGIIPVVYGECIPTSGKTIVISTEKVFELLAKHIKPHRIILLTDVNGVYTCDPKNCSNATLIDKITPQNINEVLMMLKEHEKSDVTGGIYSKVLSTSRLSFELKTEVFILSGFDVASAVEAIRGGYPRNATLITYH
ncbi:MAG: isopentenyl phosphate kinase [Desulfurococcaceae archaeon]